MTNHLQIKENIFRYEFLYFVKLSKLSPVVVNTTLHTDEFIFQQFLPIVCFIFFHWRIWQKTKHLLWKASAFPYKGKGKDFNSERSAVDIWSPSLPSRFFLPHGCAFLYKGKGKTLLVKGVQWTWDAPPSLHSFNYKKDG